MHVDEFWLTSHATCRNLTSHLRCTPIRILTSIGKDPAYFTTRSLENMTQSHPIQTTEIGLPTEIAQALLDINELCLHKSKRLFSSSLPRLQIPWSYQLFVTLCTLKHCHRLLPKLIPNIPEGKKYEFLRCVFEHRKDIAPQIRLKVCFEGRRFQPSCEKWDWMDGDTPLEKTLEFIKAACAASRARDTLLCYTSKVEWSSQLFNQLCTQVECQRLLPKICLVIPGEMRYDFLHVAFAKRAQLPHDILLKLWVLCLRDDHPTISRFFQGISWQKDKTKPLGSYTPKQLEELKDSPLTDPLLIDSFYVCQRYCLVKKPGWEMLRYLVNARRSVELSLPTQLRQALLADSVPAFLITRDMAGRRLSYSLLLKVIKTGASTIFRHLLDKGEITSDVITLPELCCLLASEKNFDTRNLLQAIEEWHPGMLKDIRDPLGQNLLWYALHGKMSCRKPIIQSLLQWGCDPLNTNQLGLTWQEANEADFKTL